MCRFVEIFSSVVTPNPDVLNRRTKHSPLTNTIVGITLCCTYKRGNGKNIITAKTSTPGQCGVAGYIIRFSNFPSQLQTRRCGLELFPTPARPSALMSADQQRRGTVLEFREAANLWSRRRNVAVRVSIRFDGLRLVSSNRRQPVYRKTPATNTWTNQIISARAPKTVLTRKQREDVRRKKLSVISAVRGMTIK